MASLCSMSGTCDDTDTIISTGKIIGIVIGSLIGLAIILTVIFIIIILCKKKKRQPVVCVQPSVNQAAMGQNLSINMNSYPAYGQSFGFNAPPPPYQQENIPVVSNGKAEI